MATTSIADIDLNLAGIGRMDHGAIGMSFVGHMQRAALDLISRPGVDKERVITLRVKVKPIRHQDDPSQLKGARLAVEVDSKLPKVALEGYGVNVKRSGLSITETDEGQEVDLD